MFASGFREAASEKKVQPFPPNPPKVPPFRSDDLNEANNNFGSRKKRNLRYSQQAGRPGKENPADLPSRQQ